MSVCRYVFKYVSMCVVCICIYVYACTYICMCVCMYVCMCVFMYETNVSNCACTYVMLSFGMLHM